MKCKLIAVALFGAITIPFSVHGFADDFSPLEIMVETGTRSSVPLENSLAAVTVVTQQDIQRTQAQTLPDVLQGVPGLQLSSSGGMGQPVSVFMRGTNSDQVLVLVDGVKVGSPTLGLTSLQSIPISQIDHIEIVRGPESSLYGSEALGGVIQIFTKKDGGTNANLSATVGSFGTYDETASANLGTQKSWIGATAEHQQTAGIVTCQPNLNAGCFSTDQNKGSYLNDSFGANGGHYFDNGSTLKIEGMRSTAFSSFDGSIFAGNLSEELQQVLSASYQVNLTDVWGVELRAGASQDNSDVSYNGTHVDTINTARNNYTWQNNLRLGENQLVIVGLEHQLDMVSGDVAYTISSRSDDAGFVQYRGSFGFNSFQVSVRKDDNQQYGGHVTGGLGYGFDLTPSTKFVATYGTAFKAPTFNQLYFPGFGNPLLKPETSKSTEVGFQGKTSDGHWSVHAYQTLVSDLIGFDSNFNEVNIDTARINGIEGQYSFKALGLDVNSTLTWQDPRQTSGVYSGNLLPRRTKEMARLEVGRAVGGYRVSASAYAEGARYDDLANTPQSRMGGYTLVDLRVEHQISKDWTVKGVAKNLFNKSYQQALYFNLPGTGVYGTLVYALK